MVILLLAVYISLRFKIFLYIIYYNLRLYIEKYYKISKYKLKLIIILTKIKLE